MSISSRRVAATLGLATCLGAIHDASAQLCLGKPSHASGPLRVGTRYVNYPAASLYGADIGVGSAAGSFASGGLALTRIQGAGQAAKQAEITVGQAVGAPKGVVELCPLLSASYQSYPTETFDGSQLDEHDYTLSAGASIGVPIQIAGGVQMVPFLMALFQRDTYTSNFSGASSFSSTDSANNGFYEIGVAIVLSQRVSITPSMQNVFNVDGAGRAAFGLAMSYTFGR